MAGLLLLLGLSGCAGRSDATENGVVSSFVEQDRGTTQSVLEPETPVQTGLVPQQVLEGETGTIHYSYYLPDDYNPQQKYPLMMAMPGYDMMWFGESSPGPTWIGRGFFAGRNGRSR